MKVQENKHKFKERIITLCFHLFQQTLDTNLKPISRARNSELNKTKTKPWLYLYGALNMWFRSYTIRKKKVDSCFIVSTGLWEVMGLWFRVVRMLKGHDWVLRFPVWTHHLKWPQIVFEVTCLVKVRSENVSSPKAWIALIHFCLIKNELDLTLNGHITHTCFTSGKSKLAITQDRRKLVEACWVFVCLLVL